MSKTTFKEKEKKKSEFVRRFRNALHYEYIGDYEGAMVAWALAEIAAPTQQEANRTKQRKDACLKKSNEQLSRLLDQNTKSLLNNIIKIK